MSNKNFKNNPALQFLTSVEDDSTEEQEINTIQNNEKLTPPEGYKINSKFIEKKTRRLQLIVKPSLYNKIKNISQKKNISVNQYIHDILEKATNE